MINPAEIARGLAGAWRLARLDREGLRAFGDTSADFWRSFQAAVIAAPVFWLLVVLRGPTQPMSDDPIRAFAIEVVGYVVGWVAYPLCAWYLIQALDRADRFIRYIAAYNWAIVLQILAFLAVALLSHAEAAPDEIVMIAAILVTGLVVYYQYFIVRTALDIDILPALGFVFLDLMISLALQQVVDWLHLRGVAGQ